MSEKSTVHLMGVIRRQKKEIVRLKRETNSLRDIVAAPGVDPALIKRTRGVISAEDRP